MSHHRCRRNTPALNSNQLTYKTSSNSVAAFDESGAQIGIVFQTASSFDTPRLMAELVAWGNQQRTAASLHPLLIIALCVVVFLEIHPFHDGNDRLSRVLTTLLLLLPPGAYDLLPEIPLLWGDDNRRYRQSSQFKRFIRESGVYDYWRKTGFPEQCQPVGPDDFRCD